MPANIEYLASSSNSQLGDCTGLEVSVQAAVISHVRDLPLHHGITMEYSHLATCHQCVPDLFIISTIIVTCIIIINVIICVQDGFDTLNDDTNFMAALRLFSHASVGLLVAFIRSL